MVGKWQKDGESNIIIEFTAGGKLLYSGSVAIYRCEKDGVTIHEAGKEYHQIVLEPEFPSPNEVVFAIKEDHWTLLSRNGLDQKIDFGYHRGHDIHNAIAASRACR
jgi:hypothetical protein